MLGIVDDNEPIIDGFCFSDLHGYSDEEVNSLAASGNVYCTTFKAMTSDGQVATFGGTIIAESWDQATEEAERRGLGEVVEGVVGGIL